MDTYKLLQHFSLAVFDSTPYSYDALSRMAALFNRTVFELCDEIVTATGQQVIKNEMTLNTAYELIETLLLALYENHPEDDIPKEALNLFDILHTGEWEPAKTLELLKQHLSNNGASQ